MAVPHGVFGGDTVMAMAGFKSAPATAAGAVSSSVPSIRLLCDGEAAGALAQELARVEADAPAAGDSVARLAAARRMARRWPRATRRPRWRWPCATS
ncbi:MAG: hypothetical protein U1F49_05460 [Rubrivivax sp.]